MADDQAEIEARVLLRMSLEDQFAYTTMRTLKAMSKDRASLLPPEEKHYYCAYCHCDWHETPNGKCVNCASGTKLCTSCNNKALKTHRTIDGGDR